MGSPMRPARPEAAIDRQASHLDRKLTGTERKQGKPMEFRSLEEFEREFFARYGPAQRGAGPYDPFLRAAAPSPAGEVSETRKPTPVQTMCAVFSWAIIAVLVVGTLAILLPMPFGVKMLSVQSGSMEPELPVSSLLWIVPAKFEKIKLGDDVTYKLASGTNVTHRVMDIDRENRILVTQGIHDSAVQEAIQYDQVVGVVRFHIKKLGGVMDKLNGDTGIYIKIMIVLAVLLLAVGSYLLSKAGSGQSGAPKKRAE